MSTGLPLEGMRVVDLSIWLYGPLAGTVLADLGARVVKIERPDGGDFSRGLSHLQGSRMTTADGRNLTWELFNRGKQSLTLNLRTPGGQEVLHRLVAAADVFVTNFQPSSLASFAALPSTLLELNPHLVFGLGAGLGSRGRFADVPSQDTAAMAYSGFMFTASASADEPFYPPGGMADVLSGTNLAFAVVSALLGRERDPARRGRLVTTSLLQTMMWAQMVNIGVPASGGEPFRGRPRREAACPLMNTYPCADGWLALGVPQLGDAVWQRLCAVLEVPALAADPRFASEAGRWREAPALVSALEAVFRTRPLAVWIERCRARDVWCAPVHRPEQLPGDAGVIEEGLMSETTDGLRHVAPPFTLAGCTPRRDGAPALGQHTAQILGELGFSPREIAALAGRGII
jgi:crotonobetainyl-CoA:carnitine CoA-transferase CaiB-like acyl-CoA transferase